MKDYTLWYTDESPFGNENEQEFIKSPDDGWDRWSLPIGNGFLGANIFGRKDTERVLITENSLCNPYTHGKGGLNSFADIRLRFGHGECENFRRYLNLNTAVAGVEYTYKGVSYKRNYFASWPDRVLVMKLEASVKGALSFDAVALIPYVRPYLYDPGDGCGKTGTVKYDAGHITLSGEMEYYQIKYEGQIGLLTDGEVSTHSDRLRVENATSAVLILATGTNYQMESRVFTEPDPHKKLAPYPHPHEKVSALVGIALQKGYDALLAAHTKDYQSLFGRVNFAVSEEIPSITTDILLENYQKGERHPYLEEMYFQYGRYLLISASRPGTYPANLQGVWNKYNYSPWSSGYWHNINVQMNYWPAFSTNLAEMFLPYVDYYKAYLPLAQQHADTYIQTVYPEKYGKKDNNGWIIGTGAWLYTISGAELPQNGHSGPGTGGLTAKLFWDYYAFTQDRSVLENLTYPALEGMALFLSKTLELFGDKYLVQYSASPEQKHEGQFVYTTGCAFDQQLIFETYKDLLQASDALGTENEITKTAKQQIDHLDPVLVGESGQVKEFREEKKYGDIGEYHHRHISQLMGLYPGTCIHSGTPDTLNAAKISLCERGDYGTGWATAHRLNAWARTKDGERSYILLRNLLEHCTFNNLWDSHPPFQIDGNFGGTAGISEMLLQSHEGYIDILPSIPDAWKNGHFDGLVARGNFVVSAVWKNKKLIRLELLSRAANECRIRLPRKCTVQLSGGEKTPSQYKDGLLSFETEKEKSYIILCAFDTSS